MSTVFSSTIYNGLKATLNKICTDKTDGLEGKLYWKKWMKEMSMSDQYEDDLEVGGPGYASETAEGMELPSGTIYEGYMKRYIARKFGLKLIITEEAVSDNKYPEIIQFAKRLKRAMYKTMDVDATNILINATSTSYPGGDGLPLASASHTLPNGGTWSNLLATAMSPSRAAMIIAISQLRKFVGHDGLYDDYMPRKILCPVEQWAVWDGLIMSKMAPEPGQFNEINVVNRLGLEETCAIPYWDNTTTNWAILTDADNGFSFRFRKKPVSNTWVENSHETSLFSISSRWDNGYTDARCVLFSNA